MMANSYLTTSRSSEVLKSISENDLAKALECPICLDMPLPPIYLCVNGHSICGICRSKLFRCGLCQDVFLDTRNLVMESIVDGITFQCKFKTDGCQQEILGQNYNKHLLECNFRPIICNESHQVQCNGSTIYYSEYFHHLVKLHEIGGDDDRDDQFLITECIRNFEFSEEAEWPFYYKCFQDHVFLLSTVMKESIVYWTISVIGNDEVASKYFARVIIFRKASEVPRVEWKTPVFSIRKSFLENKSKCVAVYPKVCLLPYCSVIVDSENVRRHTWDIMVVLSTLPASSEF